MEHEITVSYQVVPCAEIKKVLPEFDDPYPETPPHHSYVIENWSHSTETRVYGAIPDALVPDLLRELKLTAQYILKRYKGVLSHGL